MTHSAAIQHSLTRLMFAYPPPANPLGFDLQSLPTQLASLPPDLFAFIRIYGSGLFRDKNSGMLLNVLNPYERNYSNKVDTDLALLRRLKKEEGDAYVPYPIWPESGGLLLWAYGDNRKHFFWKTDGDPGSWTVVVMYDLEIFTAFDLSLLQFLEQLLCGDLDCTFIGCSDNQNRIDPTSVQFIPRVLPA